MAAKTTAGRVRRERLARDRWFHPGRYLTPPSSAVAREFFPEETQHPKRVSRDDAIRPSSTSSTSSTTTHDSNVANLWDASGHEFSRFIFFPFSSFTRHDISPDPHLGTREAALEWLNGIEVKWNDRPCVIHIRVSRLASPGSRKAGPERWFPGDETRRCRWLSWLKPFWLSCRHNYA